MILGIPDFRVFPDPWIGLEDDRAKARRLAALVAERSFEDAVRTYWEITPDTPRPLAAKFTRHVLEADGRTGEWLDRTARDDGGAPDGWWLDVGCGTGDALAAGARRGMHVMGVDIALRWLVIAQRRVEVSGRSAPLVCGNAEYLPFPPRTFARVMSLGTLEHCRDADRVLVECRRVLRAGSPLRLRTVNRYSLLPEPHVGVWGVGFVPRRWADRYVHWRSGQRYLHHRPLSARELRRGLLRAGFRGVAVGAAALLDSDRARVGPIGRWAAPVYEAARRMPLVRSIVGWIAPLLEARATAP